MDEVVLRRATDADSDAVTDVYLASFRATYSFPLAHTDEQVRAWIRDVTIASRETWVAVVGGRIVAMLVLDGRELDQLYLDPTWIGRGIGGRLMALAKSLRPAGLRLYTFQVNARARSFYERHGFLAKAFGDGAGNEEREPDVRYEWTPGG